MPRVALSDVGVVIRPSPGRYWRQLHRNIHSAIAAVAGLMAASVLLRLVAHSSTLLAVTGALVLSAVLVAAPPYGALVHRSIVLGEERLVFHGIFRGRSIRLEDVGMISAAGKEPDPQLRVIDVNGRLVWRIHLAYWPHDLEDRLRAAGPIGKLRSFAPHVRG